LSLALPARAKLNLDLAVLGRRRDGYHDVRTKLQAIALHDLLQVSVADKTELVVTGLAAPNDAGNLVLKAQAALEEAAGRRLPAVFKLHKRVPSGAGLGGASSDAATALRALTALYQLKSDLAPIAAGLGADVTFFLTGGMALATGRGDGLRLLPDVAGWFALAWPGIGLSTAAVYQAWDEVGGDSPNQLRRAAGHAEPRLDEFAGKLGEGWQMTGSGSAFFRRCADEDEAQRAVAQLDCWTAVTHGVRRWI